MEQTIALIGIPGSILADEIAACLSGDSFSHQILSLDAPFEGKPLTIGRGVVSWEGVDLLGAGAIFVERSVFPWPQTRYSAEYEESGLTQAQWAFYQRESASLLISALHLASTERPMINPPSAAHLAISPSIALDLLEREGITVHPWRMEPAAEGEISAGRISIDACGRDRWHTPGPPVTGEQALTIEPFEGAVTAFMVVGGRIAGAVRFPGPDSWALGQEAKVVGTEIGAADLAIRSAAILGLDFAAISVREDQGRVLFAEASPDLEQWNRILEGRVAELLAEHLISLAGRESSGSENQK